MNEQNYLFPLTLLNRNLKITNVLIDNDAIMKITDLNIFKVTPQVVSFLKSPSSAPETLLKNELTAKSDIWSVGIILLEMIAGNPWVLKNGDQMSTEQITRSLSRNQKFQIPIKLKKDFYDFLHHMLQTDPNKRTLLNHINYQNSININRPTTKELLKHKFLRDVEQDERSLLNQVSMKEKSFQSQASWLSRKQGRTSSQQLQVTSTTNQQSSQSYVKQNILDQTYKKILSNFQQTDMKSFISQKSEGAASKYKVVSAQQQQSKFHPSPSITSLHNDEHSHNRLDPNSPRENKFHINKQVNQKYEAYKSALSKPSASMVRKVTHDFARGQTTSSRVSYLKMLSVGDNEQYVDDKSFTQSQMQQQQSQQTPQLEIGDKYEDDEKQNQNQDKVEFIESRMQQIMENSDYPNSEMVSIAPYSPQGQQDKVFSFIKIPSGQINSNNNSTVLNNGNNSQNNSQNLNSNQHNYQLKGQSTRQNSLLLKVNDQPVDNDFFNNPQSSSQHYIKISQEIV